MTEDKTMEIKKVKEAKKGKEIKSISSAILWAVPDWLRSHATVQQRQKSSVKLEK